MKKYTISGLLLLAVSAVIANVLPSKKSVNDLVVNGHVTATDGSGFTCAGSVGDNTCFTQTAEAEGADSVPNMGDSDTRTDAIVATAAAATDVLSGN